MGCYGTAQLPAPSPFQPVSSCGSQEIGPGKPPCVRGHQLWSPSRNLQSLDRKDGEGKNLRAHAETVFYKVPAFTERHTALPFGLYLDLTGGCGGPACRWGPGGKTSSTGHQKQGHPWAIRGGTGGVDQTQGPGMGRGREGEERRKEEGSGRRGGGKSLCASLPSSTTIPKSNNQLCK